MFIIRLLLVVQYLASKAYEFDFHWILYVPDLAPKLNLVKNTKIQS